MSQKLKKKSLHAYTSNCKGSLTGEVPQMADEQRVRSSEGDGLGLFHCAHGQLCVRCKTDTPRHFVMHHSLFKIKIFISRDSLEN